MGKEKRYRKWSLDLFWKLMTVKNLGKWYNSMQCHHHRLWLRRQCSVLFCSNKKWGGWCPPYCVMYVMLNIYLYPVSCRVVCVSNHKFCYNYFWYVVNLLCIYRKNKTSWSNINLLLHNWMWTWLKKKKKKL